jgi:RimJ/RimL family protein N-acetyltransferase
MAMDRTLTTDRLVLAPYAVADFEELAGLWGDPLVTRFIGGEPKSREQVWSQVLRSVGHWSVLGFGFWTLRDRQGGQLLGEVGFGDHRRDMTPSFAGAPEMGWVVAPAQQGRGLAAEAVRAALGWAEAHLPSRLVCMIHPEHAASIRLAEAFGFQPFATTEYHKQPATLFERLKP